MIKYLYAYFCFPILQAGENEKETTMKERAHNRREKWKRMLRPRCLESVAFHRPALCHSALGSWSPSLPYLWSPSQHSGHQITELQSTVGQATKELHSLKITSTFHFPLTKAFSLGKYQNLTPTLRTLLRPNHSTCSCHGNRSLSIASQRKRGVECVALRSGQGRSIL